MKSLCSVAMFAAAFLASVAVIGCGRSGTSTTDGSSGGAPAEDITLEAADRAAYDEVIARHSGKVVLVDFWATWCGPCVQQFPHTVELSRKSDPSKLAVVSVSMDEPDNKDMVLKFLQDRNAAFDNLISVYGVGQKAVEVFDITDGAIPHYKIYDRTGTLRFTSNSGDEVDSLLEQLFNEA